MKKVILSLLFGVMLCVNLAVANEQIRAIDKFLETTPCDKLSQLDENKTIELLNLVYQSNETIYHAISKCDLTPIHDNIKELLAINSVAKAMNDINDMSDDIDDILALKIAQKLKEQGLNFARIDEVLVPLIEKEVISHTYFINYLVNASNFDLLKFYLDNGAPINIDTRALTIFPGEILIFIGKNCDSTKKALKNKKPTDEILNFVKTEEYKDFRDKNLDLFKEILRHKKLSEFKISPIPIFENLFSITNDKKYEIFIKGDIDGQ